MASKVVAICALVILVRSLAFAYYVDVPSNKYISPKILCHSTTHPSFCKSVLPAAQNAWAPQRKTILHPMQKQHLPHPMTSDGVWPKVIGSVTVSKDYTTIAEAVSGAPDYPKNGFFVIHASEGVYQEYISIGEKKEYIMMIGAGISKTIITGNRNAKDGLKTKDTATFSVAATGFVAVDITFQNTAGPTKEQVVAVFNSADQFAFYQCSFEGYHDTLYVDSNRQFYRECDVYETVNFIFGDAKVLLQNCNLYPRRQ